ncbi:MAG: three-Cys-motif partner protein TcmP [Rhizomicrobium sp.]
MPEDLQDDGLPVAEVGEWSPEKHDRLRRYVDISREVRKKFIRGAGASYIDLYCGPGRSKIRETGRVIDGSPLVAAAKALESSTAFTRILIGVSDGASVAAASARLTAQGFINWQKIR